MKKWLILFILAVVPGCFQSWGESFTSGAADGLTRRDKELNRMIGELVATARDSALPPQFVDRLTSDLRLGLTSSVDSILLHAGTGLTRELVLLRDSLLNEYLRTYVSAIKNDLLGEDTRKQLAALRNELLGVETNILVSSLRSSLVGDSARAELAALRTELLGGATTTLVDSLITGAIAAAANGIRGSLQPILREEEGFFKKNATTVAWVAGGIILLLVVLGVILFTKLKKYSEMVNVITYQIDATDPAVKKDLTNRIKQQSKQAGIEGELNALLVKRGIIKPREEQESTVELAV